MLRNIARISVITLTLATLGWGQAPEKVIFSFNGNDGRLPDSGLVADAHGNVYGTTFDGGPNAYGNVYELTPAAAGMWKETVLYTFSGTDGAFPTASLTLDANGNLYGTAQAGGEGQCVTGNGGQWLGCGVVFKLTPTSNGWQESTVYSFQPGVDKGVIPAGGVTFDRAGNLYGTTWAPGVEGDFVSLKARQDPSDNTFWGCDLPGCGGTVYKLTPTQSGWQETDIYAFTGGADGSSSQANLLIDSAGNLYGTTAYGGDNHCRYGCGLVFKLSQSGGNWTETILHSFAGQPNDGAAPTGNLTMDAAGNIYSTTSDGGASRQGTVFQLSPAGQQWNESVIYNFTGALDGGVPFAGLTQDSRGNLYGAASSGGSGSSGVVYRLTPNGGHWSDTTIHTFSIGHDGQSPYAAPILQRGLLLGTTQSGGADRISGAVYQILP